jgi:hypothetical protein
VWATFQKLHSLAILLVYKGKKNVGDHVPFVRSVFFFFALRAMLVCNFA